RRQWKDHKGCGATQKILTDRGADRLTDKAGPRGKRRGDEGKARVGSESSVYRRSVHQPFSWSDVLGISRGLGLSIAPRVTQRKMAHQHQERRRRECSRETVTTMQKLRGAPISANPAVFFYLDNVCLKQLPQ
ncbi:unnamed protein product, partial [Amoebophrya sp. A25]